MAKSFKPNQKQQITALIATPALDGRVDVHYASMVNQVSKLGVLNNIDINICMLSYESILPMARNQLLTIAIEKNVDCMIFIDSDVGCDPNALINIIKNPEDVIAIPTIKKNDNKEEYDFWFEDEKQFETIENNLQLVNAVSTSCLKLSRKSLQALAKNSVDTYFRENKIKNICQYDFEGEVFMGEDIFLCEKLRDLGFKIWIDFSSTCVHIGPKIYKGDYKKTVLNHVD